MIELASGTGSAHRLRIAEMFASIQGEGSWVGMPSTFVRISGCNLRCRWCDTPYASWQPEGPVLEVDAIVDAVAAEAIRHVVITGGEPMLFDAVVPLCEALRARGHVLTIETAGTIFRDLACDLMSISPKLGNSTPDEAGWRERHERTRLQPPVLRRLLERYPYQLKFVVDPDRGEDVLEIDALLEELGPVEPGRVLLMPEGTDPEVLHRRAKLLVPICLTRGWRLTPRFHIDLFGNSKGT